MKFAQTKLIAPVCLTLAATIFACNDSHHHRDTKIKATYELVLASGVEWTPLNPARGDKGPKAGTLWGNRSGLTPTGFLVKFVDGFSSPPHTHNVTYRGVVINGLVHNDDPDAEEMWTPTGSYWAQPAGEIHITSAKGTENIAYIEIEQGPYLVLPVEQASDNGERPVNIHKSNLVWLDASNTAWINSKNPTAPKDGPKIAFLWGTAEDDDTNGTLLTLPPGFMGSIQTRGIRAIVIEGRSAYKTPDLTETTTLDPGSYFGARGDSTHILSCGEEEGCTVYLRSNGKYEVITL